VGKFGPEAKKALEVVGGEALKVALSFEDVGQKVVETGNQGARATKLSSEQIKAMAERTNRLNEELRQWRNFNGEIATTLPEDKTKSFAQAVYGALAPLVTFSEIDAEVAAGFEQIREAARKAAEELRGMTRTDLKKDLRDKEKQLKEMAASGDYTGERVRKLKEEIAALKAELAEPEWLTEWRANLDNFLVYSQAAFAGFNAIFSQAQKNKEIEIENEYKKRLDLINATYTNEEERQKAITSLEAEFQIKRTSAKRAAAKQQKAIALMEAVVNTASAVTEALPNIFLAALVGAMGAVQIALIARQPIPLARGAVFDKPTRFTTEEGRSYVAGEAGSELLVPDAKLRSIISDELKKRGSGGGGPRTIILTLNGKRVAEAMLPDLKALSGQGKFTQDIIGLVRSET
jgi:hypothetical protein